MRIITHNGTFHPDEIFAVAALKLRFEGEEIEVVRTRDAALFAGADFVVDVGSMHDPSRNRFDHHQGGIEPRPNGIPYASFGLVWKRYGPELCGSQDIADRLDTFLVQYVDAKDNGVNVIDSLYGDVFPYTLFDYIKSFRPTWKESADGLEGSFHRLVGFAQGILEREIRIAKDDAEGRRMVEEAYAAAEDKRAIVLDRYYPWEQALSGLPGALFAVYPSLAGDWHIQAVRDDLATYINRKDLPESWAGLRDEDLVRATGVADAVFCHTGRFFAVAKSKEGARRLAVLAAEA